MLTLPPNWPGASSNISFLLDVARATPATVRAAGSLHLPEHAGGTQPHAFVLSPSARAPPSSSHAATRELVHHLVIPTEDRAVHLMRLYFSDTGLMFPFISENKVMSSYYHFKERHFSGIPRSFLCLLNMMFAFATYISAKPEQAVSKSAAESEIFFNRAFHLSSNGFSQANDLQSGKTFSLAYSAT